MKDQPLVGFVGQGFVGKSYADDFESRGYSVVRYALEEPYAKNKAKIAECDVVFIAVPTPTTLRGFDSSIVEEALRLVGKGKIAVIKSTLVPGLTRKLQGRHSGLTILFSPEFLNAATAAHDAAHPFSNVIGLPVADASHEKAAELVHRILPGAAFAQTCSSEEAEIYKYAHNVSGYMQVLTYNLAYDLGRRLGANWETVQQALAADPMVSNWYINPVHKSGRGAGGPCFIKDFAAFSAEYARRVGDAPGVALLRAAERKNIALLAGTKKDTELLAGVYGKKALVASGAGRVRKKKNGSTKR